MSQVSQEIAHNWAHQSETGRRSYWNFYRENDTVYSYGSHFPVATHLTDHVILFNREESSKTTSEHQIEVEMAIPRGKKVIKTHSSLIKAVTGPWGKVTIWDHTPAGRAQRIQPAVRAEIDTIISKIRDYQKLRARAKKRSYIPDIQAELRYLQAIYDYIPFDRRKLTKTQRYYLKVGPVHLVNTEDIQAEVEAEKELQRERTQREVEAFRTFKRPNVVNSDKTYLRLDVVNRRVETSRGIQVDLNEALAAAEICRKAKEKNRPVSPDFTIAGWWVDTITANGSFHAGCHVISWNEIKRLIETARQYGLDREALEISQG
jgi:hypothetical protein